MVRITKSKRKKILSDVSDQLKKFTGRLTFDDVVAVGIGLWAAKHMKNPTHFISGVLGYKLARTEGGMPPVSQIAGLAILGGVGVLGLKGIEDKTELTFFGIPLPPY